MTSLFVLKHVDHGHKTIVERSMTQPVARFSYVLFDRRWDIFIPAVTERDEFTFLGQILKTQNT